VCGHRKRKKVPVYFIQRYADKYYHGNFIAFSRLISLLSPLHLNIGATPYIIPKIRDLLPWVLNIRVAPLHIYVILEQLLTLLSNFKLLLTPNTGAAT
jgi:hypothetical protein